MKRMILVFGLCSTIGITTAQAIEIEGVHIADRVEVGGQSLLLNGASVRSKFFFDIYIGALYLANKTESAQEAINSKSNKRVLLYFLYGEVPKDRLVKGWTIGFEKNSKGHMKELQARLNHLNGFFQDMKKGDTVSFDFIDHGATIVMMNDKAVGSIEGVDFQQALLAVWLGDNPADNDLKAGMLGE